MPTYSLVYPVFRYPVDQILVLLGLQRSGKWQGYVNGFGGEVERDDESYHDCARRELREESGLIASEGNLTLHGKIMYVHEHDLFRPSAVHVYLAEWDGEIPTGGELGRNLFPVRRKCLPFEKMPPNDILWLPRMLNGEYVEATLTYETTPFDPYILKSVEYVNDNTKPQTF